MKVIKGKKAVECLERLGYLTTNRYQYLIGVYEHFIMVEKRVKPLLHVAQLITSAVLFIPQCFMHGAPAVFKAWSENKSNGWRGVFWQCVYRDKEILKEYI